MSPYLSCYSRGCPPPLALQVQREEPASVPPDYRAAALATRRKRRQSVVAPPSHPDLGGWQLDLTEVRGVAAHSSGAQRCVGASSLTLQVLLLLLLLLLPKMSPPSLLMGLVMPALLRQQQPWSLCQPRPLSPGGEREPLGFFRRGRSPGKGVYRAVLRGGARDDGGRTGAVAGGRGRRGRG